MSLLRPGIIKQHNLNPISHQGDETVKIRFYPVKSSDQVNAIDTTVTFKLSDDEIDDMKLSIAKALKWVIRLDH